METITPDEVIKELNRERIMRLAVYGNQLREGKMTQKTYDHRIACIDKAIEYAESEKKRVVATIPNLFGE